MVKNGIGQDSHRFESQASAKPLILGGVVIPGYPGLSGNSDADVILHALTNAVSGVSGINILGKISDELCLKEGITDSRVYLKKALETLTSYRLSHISVSVECKRPILAPFVADIKASLAQLVSLDPADIGLTATTGEGLSSFGRGEGIGVFVLVTAQKKSEK